MAGRAHQSCVQPAWHLLRALRFFRKACGNFLPWPSPTDISCVSFAHISFSGYKFLVHSFLENLNYPIFSLKRFSLWKAWSLLALMPQGSLLKSSIFTISWCWSFSGTRLFNITIFYLLYLSSLFLCIFSPFSFLMCTIFLFCTFHFSQNTICCIFHFVLLLI